VSWAKSVAAPLQPWIRVNCFRKLIMAVPKRGAHREAVHANQGYPWAFSGIAVLPDLCSFWATDDIMQLVILVGLCTFAM
jgi:hypothetical protein